MEKKLNLRRTVRSKKLTRKAPGKKVKSKKKFQKYFALMKVKIQLIIICGIH